jgi:hypothetical protein
VLIRRSRIVRLRESFDDMRDNVIDGARQRLDKLSTPQDLRKLGSRCARFKLAIDMRD